MLIRDVCAALWTSSLHNLRVMLVLAAGGIRLRVFAVQRP